MRTLMWTQRSGCGLNFPLLSRTLVHCVTSSCKYQAHTQRSINKSFRPELIRRSTFTRWRRMFKMLDRHFIAVFLLATLTTGFAQNNGPVPDDCMRCICEKETQCTDQDPLCRWDRNSLSCGRYQIKLAYWQDARLKGGSLRGGWKTCAACPDCSRRAVQGYMKRYATFARLGHTPTCEDFSRLHNGGLYGHTYPETLKYWADVKKCLDN